MRKLVTVFFTMLLGLHFGYAQKVVEGVVTGADTQESLPGVNVFLPGTSTGTVTDTEGNYSLTVPDDAETLKFSFVGYSTKEVEIGNRTTIDVSLEPTAQSIEEFVVVGYGVQKKSLVTGSISKMNVEDMNKNQSRIEQSIQGKTAGVNIMQESGSPGSNMTIRIRGTGSNRNSDPLFIVDGMRTDGMDYLNPDDIESVEVLKDAASAAIYGAEGANGVVLVTTKSADKGESRINYSFSNGWQEAVNYVEVMDATQYADYFSEADWLESNPDNLGQGTDWMNEIFEIAPMQQHNLSIEGGNEKTSVFASASYYDQDGIVGGNKTNFNRATARLNLDHEVKDWLKIGTRISYTNVNRKSINENNEFGGVISNAMALDPLTPLYVDNVDDLPDKYLPQIYDNFSNPETSSLKAPGDKGFFGMSPYVQNEIANPVAQMNNDHNRWQQDKLVASFFTELKPVEGLNIRSSYDIDLSYGNSLYWTPKYYYHSINYNFRNNTGQSTDKWYTWQLENVADYSMDLGDHSMNFMAGMTAREYNHFNLNGYGEVLQEESWNFAVLDAVLSDTTRAAAGGFREEERLFSYFGRVQYDYQEKYMLNATFRADGSSKLAEGNKYRYFPSVSVGWVVSNEDFELPEMIDFLKIRASWGRNGSIGSLNNFDYVSTIVSNAESSYYLSGGDRLTGAEPASLANPDLVWETSEQIDVGFDLYLFDSQLTLSTDYFKKTTIDLITGGPVPFYVGNDQPLFNAGDVVNSGVEMELGLKKKLGDLSYDITAHASYLKNEVTYIGNEASVLLGANLGTTGAITRAEEGKPMWHFYGFEDDGVFSSWAEVESYTNEEGDLIQPRAVPGDVKFKDINGDGKISEDDKTMIGNPHPKWTFGLSTSLEYKGFDLNLFFNARTGVDTYFGAYRTDLGKNNKPEFFYDDAWTPQNNAADFPRMTVNDRNNNFSHNSMFVFDGSFIRLQSAELGYTLPNNLTDKVKVERLRVFVSGQNLFLLTKYPGDPEIGNTGGFGGSSIGVDRGLYPRSRVISFGAKVTI
ncbi:MAG: SusC/RagA family TonB-linked outer membrane protein [Bacteroidota bacterium]